MKGTNTDKASQISPVATDFVPIAPDATTHTDTTEDVNTPMLVELNFDEPLSCHPTIEKASQIAAHITATHAMSHSQDASYRMALTLPKEMLNPQFQMIWVAVDACPLQSLTVDTNFLDAQSLAALMDTMGKQENLAQLSILNSRFSETQRTELTTWCDQNNVILSLENPSETITADMAHQAPATNIIPCAAMPDAIFFQKLDAIANKSTTRTTSAEQQTTRDFPSNLTFEFNATVNGTQQALTVTQCKWLMENVAQTTLENPYRDRYDLDFTSAQLGDEQMLAIADVIRANAHVSKLKVSHNNYTIRGALALSRAMQSNDHIHTLGMSGDFLANASDTDRQAFLQGIEDCSALQTWDLSYSVMTEKALQDVLNTLLINGHIQSLDLTGVRIREHLAFGRTQDKALDKQTIQSRLQACFEAQDKRFAANVNHITVDITGSGRLILVNDVKREAVKGTALAAPHDQTACAALAPLVTHIPLRVRYDSLIQITAWQLAQDNVQLTQMASRIQLTLHAAGLTRADLYGATNPAMDDAQQAEAMHDFCENVSDSMQQLFQEERRAEKRNPLDTETLLQCAKKRLQDILCIVQDKVGLTSAKGDANLLQSAPAISQQMLDQLCQWILHMASEKEGSGQKQFVQAEHTDLAMAMIAVVGENADEAKRQFNAPPDHGHPVEYWYPVSRENDLHALQKAYLSALSFSVYTTLKQPMLTPARKQALLMALVMLACAAIFATFYFTAPLIFTASVVAHTAWLGTMGAAGQASMCTGAVMLSMALIAGFCAMRQAHQNKVRQKTLRVIADDAHSMAGLPTASAWQAQPTKTGNPTADAPTPCITLPNATRQGVHTFFGGHSMAQDPNVSPERPLVGNPRHRFFAPADMVENAADEATTAHAIDTTAHNCA